MGNRSYNSIYTRSVEHRFTHDGVSGSFEFDLNVHAPRNNIVEYFYFIDMNGELIEATAGNVDITMAADSPIFNTLHDGSFKAKNAAYPDRTKPSGYGMASKVRITLSGIAGSGIVGFSFLVTQNIS